MGALDGIKFHFVDSIDGLFELKRWLGERRPTVLGIDTETTGLNWWQEKLRLVQVGDGQTGWAMDARHWGGVVKELLENYEGEWVLHNAKFDSHFLEREYGVKMPWHKMHDTRVMAHLVDPVNSTALKSITTRYVDPRAASSQKMLDEAMHNAGWTWATVPVDFQPYWVYAALDTVLTVRAYEHLRPMMTKYKQMYEMEMAVLAILFRMEERGSRIDLQHTNDAISKLSAYVAACRDWCTQAHGVSITSPPQVVKRLTELGYTWEKRTAGGAPSLDEEVLLELVGLGCSLAEVTLRTRKTNKLVSSYLENFVEIVAGDLVHPQINSLGARTGRMSIQNPALQTLPRADEDNPLAILARDCFIPREDHKLVMIDFDQIELRLMAHFSGDPTMIDVMKSGQDPFTAFAQAMYDDPTIVKSDPRRQLVKNASYAKLYGAGKPKFALTARITLQAASEFLDLYDQRFPGVVDMQRRVGAVAAQRSRTEGEAYVVSPMGRVHPCGNDQSYKLVNYLIQGTAADVLKLKLIELDASGLGQYMILPVHDEVIFDVPTELADEVAREAAHVMREDKIFAVPLTVGVDGPHDRWGDKYRKG